ncbi:hypothetical protein [Humisphaera borealis]|uniref:Uncharacterized protein n=1 Tax=Humisphaera borealis TaxID=2807512 RepID=A0A7M2WTA3_9BACT|nr:hypothetical protein [Humisphaera borealis]QOV88755.1 hypothetical protein IPV69_21375 [Humisphaera borealis]
MPSNNPLIIDPTVDLGKLLADLIGDTGGLQPLMGGYRIRVFHNGAFPWDSVFKTLLFRDFKIYVTNHKADIAIEAQP